MRAVAHRACLIRMVTAAARLPARCDFPFKLFIKNRDSTNLQHRPRSGHCFINSIPPRDLYCPRTNNGIVRNLKERAVRTSTIVMIAFAVVFGIISVFVAQSWLTNQAEMRARNMEAQKKPVVTNTIVVA